MFDIDMCDLLRLIGTSTGQCSLLRFVGVTSCLKKVKPYFLHDNIDRAIKNVVHVLCYANFFKAVLLMIVVSYWYKV